MVEVAAAEYREGDEMSEGIMGRCKAEGCGEEGMREPARLTRAGLDGEARRTARD
jgi:hypothetical protein